MSDSGDGSTPAEREERFRALVEGIPGAVYRRAFQPPRAFQYLSDAVASIVGYPAAELLRPGPAADALAPVAEDLDAVVAAVTEATSEGRIYDVEYRVTHADGTLRWVHDRGQAERDETGAVTSINGVLFDVTERKQAESALEEQRARLLALMASIPDHIYFKDADSRFLMLSSAMARSFGLRDPSEAVGKTDFDFFPEVNARPSLEDEQAVMRTGLPVVDREEPEQWPDGRETWASTTKLPYFDTHGRIVGTFGISRDITARKQGEQALMQAQALLGALMDNTPDHIYFKDAESRFTRVSTALARSVGASEPAEVIGKTDFDFFTPDHARPAFEAEQEIMRTGVPVVDLEELETRLDGRVTWASTTKVRRTDDNGNVVGTFGISRDITERKRVEAELTEANERLLAAIARAEEMTREAELANMAKSDFLANMSHEIRTPMNGVIGMIGLLLDTELDDGQRHYAETVRASSESLLEILNDILDFSKIEAGSVELEMVDFDLRGLLDDFAALPALRAHERDLEFICAVAPDVPTYLTGDPGRLRQVLLNLAGNALKFTHEGEIAVRASLVSETDADAVVRFSVKDTGIGIAEESQGRLFEKFTQADTSTTRQYGGTGLGLAISKRLVELMGGEIGMTSEAGRGSEFWFRVRLAKQAGGDHGVLPTAEIRGTRILVVDDNATNREVLVTQLKAWGARPEDVRDGPAALVALASARDAGDPFAAAILDMQMPAMDGADLARIIKADETLRRTHLVLMTSLGQRGDARQSEEIGFAAYLVKPTRQSDLFDSLSTVLAQTPTGRPARIVTRHAVREMRRGAVRILLAEDNITNQDVALGLLRKLGLRADLVVNGAEAVTALETIPYDLVLMDVQMPGMDGLEATRRVRDPESAVLNHAVPIVAMTAHAMRDDRERCLAAGMDDYVTKPIAPEALAAALDRWLPQPPQDTLPLDQSPARPQPATPAGPGGGEPEVFDAAGMLARLMGDEELASTVARGFLGDAPRLIAQLRVALEAGDAPGAARLAHTIKGASAAVGGDAVRALAAATEEAAAGDDIAAAMSLLPELEASFDRLRAAIADLAGDVRPESGAGS